MIPDGRIARVRELTNGIYKVRVKRTTSQSHQFIKVPRKDLDCTPNTGQMGLGEPGQVIHAYPD